MVVARRKAKAHKIISWFLFIFSLLWISYFPRDSNADVSYQIEQIRVSYFDSRPFGWVDKNNLHHGIGPDLARLLISSAAKESAIVFSPSSSERNIHQLLSGDADLLYHPEEIRLRKNAIPVAKVGDVPIVILTLPGLKITSLDDVRGRRVASMVRHKDNPLLDGMDLILTPVEDRLLVMLIAGRVDAVVGYLYTFHYQFRQFSYKSEDFEHYSVGNVEAYLWTNKDSVVVKDLAHWREVAKVKNSPKILNELIKKHTFEESTP